VQVVTKLHSTEQSRADYIKQNIPAGYFGEPYDIGHLVAFLAYPFQGLERVRGKGTTIPASRVHAWALAQAFAEII
jgi:NAD(P)-dependent dehydrogenase (short-subunit alcohol dehydrogenase family)